MSGKEEFHPFSEVKKKLADLCRQGQTGSFYIISDVGHGAVFVLDKGDIVDIVYKTIRGPVAIPLLRRVQKAKFIFKAGNIPNVAAEHAKEGITMPPTAQVLKMLGIEQVEDATAPEKSAPTASKGKLLVVEDSTVQRKALVRVLLENGYSVVEASDGLEALGQVGVEAPDMVLLDLTLPKMDGYQVLDYLKEKEATQDIPVLILTSRDSLIDKLKGRMSDSDEYITKPFDEGKLLGIIEHYIG